MKGALQGITLGLAGLVVFGLLVFWPAGTFDYWQGWAFIAVFAASTTIPSIYLAATNPAALRRRMKVGPAAETRLLQKIIITFVITTIQNGYAAANINVESDQTVVSTGVYSVVRHPMYFGNVVLMIGIPPALGSYWGLVFVTGGSVALVTRILNEEKVLTQQLAGCLDYAQRVHFRLVPYVW
ncbi:MAG: hypothetical protein QOC63_4313 [Mycobacterium sp.]|jgi:isoprenylcysteine carboxyl methyltransferase (ICMT) family protein YpbQ|nr:hypothetical protein [Mycobacterium sp.]